MLFQVAGSTYRVRTPCARDQFLFLRQVLPMLPALRSIGLQSANTYSVLLAVDSVSEANLIQCVEEALMLCERKTEDGWAPIDPSHGLALPETLEIAAAVVSHNFGPYFAVKKPDLGKEHTWQRGPRFNPVMMPDDLDWLYRPVLRGMCKAESLIDGALKIEHLAEMNNVLDAADENQRRATAVAEAEAANRR